MKIELKKVSFSERMSEETNAFVADVYVDGKKVGYAKNEGHGGNTDVRSYPETHDQFKKAEDYCKSLPDTVHDLGGNEPFTMKSDLESVVDDLLEQWLKEKEEKKIQNYCKKGVVYKTPNGHGIISWKNTTIDSMLMNPIMVLRLKKVVEDLKKEGKEIVNTNLVGIEL